MWQAFFYGMAGMAGALVAYTAYDALFSFCVWLRGRKTANTNPKRRKR